MRELEIIRQLSDNFTKNIRSATGTYKRQNNYLWQFGVLNKTRLLITFYGKLSTDAIRLKREWYFVNFRGELIFDGGNNINAIAECYKQSLAAEDAAIES